MYTFGSFLPTLGLQLRNLDRRDIWVGLKPSVTLLKIKVNQCLAGRKRQKAEEKLFQGKEVKSAQKSV
jgi:hypothetical protein